MAPPELGSQSEDSQPEQGPLEYFEQRLESLKQDTLKLKKRNDEYIKSIQHPNSISTSKGWKGSPIDVPPPHPSTIPAKLSPHQRTKSRALLSVDVEKILRESSKLREKVHESLRQSEKKREEDLKYLQELRRESRELSSLPTIGSLVPAICPGAIALSHSTQGGILSSIKSAIRKISGDSPSALKSRACPPLLTPVPEKRSARPPIQLIPATFEENDSNSNASLPPPIKPRTKRAPPPRPTDQPQPPATRSEVTDPRPRPRISRPQMPPPPQPPQPSTTSILQLQDLKNMYSQSPVSDEETTLTLPTPVPKPRPVLQRQESSLWSESSSESEFEYISNPLKIQTVIVLEESDDSLPISEAIIPTAEPEMIKPVKPSRFQKNSQSINTHIPKHYMKPLDKEENSDEIPVSQIFPQKQPRVKVRSGSPPPPQLQTSFRKISFGGADVTLSHLSEEESTTSSVEDLPQQYCQPDEETAIPPQSEQTFRTSALQLGVPVQPLQVPILPWIKPETPTNYIIPASPFHFPEIETITTATVEGVKLTSEEESAVEKVPKKKCDMNPSHGHVLDMDQEIQDEFSFLDDIHAHEDSDSVVSKPNSEDESTFTFDKSCRYNLLEVAEIESEVVINANIASPLKICPELESIQEYLKLEKVSHDEDETPQPITPDLSPILPLPDEFSRFASPSPPPPFIPEPPSGPPPPPPMESLINGDKDNISFSILPVVPLDERRFRGSIFHTLEPVDLDLSQFDKDFIQENFMRMESPENEKRRQSLARKPNNPESDVVDPINLLSLKLKQAIEIGSRKIQQENSAIIFDAVKTLNPENMTADDVQVLLQMIPKEHEGVTFAQLDDNQCKTLPEGYKIMKSLVNIPRLSKKLNAINFLLNFDDGVKCIEFRTETLKTAIHSVRNSENFVKILRIVLAVVNQFGKQIKGFQIQSLERLARKKSCKSGVPLLNYIVKQIGDSMPEALDFYKDFKCIEEVSKISLAEVKTILKELEDEMNNVLNEVLATQQDSVDDETEIRTGLIKSLASAQNMAGQLQEISKKWDATVQSLKELAEFFGMFNTDEKELLDFFHTIQHFVVDFKQALLANEKLFAPAIDPMMCTEAPVRMRKSLPVALNKTDCANGDAKVTKRQSVGPTTLKIIQTLGKESGQPQEFVDAITVLGRSTRSPPRKKKEMADGECCRRRKNRNSQNFGNIEVHRERERQ